ncbi:hypothetical protein Ga0466249_002295 [Sporomusaceae bacterium BoRhaA]|uniref:hypothetical protein n=1 Tax=Pelorhabdus rhamnosifermentans TaxID=2772457 RepID=UPI001C061E8A|nr:hypothetical protein [Pelorhabdus rhamnosifermentans]MBU2701181.1 hypothetical protein [Pelorhabdus rhamnosifermentans]
MATVKFEGTEVSFRDKTYIMPDLPYIAYEDYEAMIKIVDIARSLDAMHGNPLLNPFTGKTLKDARKLIMLAIKRNYPDIDEEEFIQNLRLVDVILAAGVLIDREVRVQEMVSIDKEKNVEPQAKGEAKS